MPNSSINTPAVVYAGIVVALPEELATLTAQKLAPGECLTIAENIIVAYAGAGALNAERAAHLLLDKGVNVLISWGCAAGLSAALKPGDLLLAAEVVSARQTVYQVNPEWLAHLRNLFALQLNLSGGTLLESRHIVAASTEKRAIHQQSGAVALDMESAAVFGVANEAQLPCLAIRAIADPVTLDLPQAVVVAMNAQGQIELSKLLSHVLTHPWEIPGLIRLGLNFSAAGKTLKTVAGQLDRLINFQHQVFI